MEEEIKSQGHLLMKKILKINTHLKLGLAPELTEIQIV